VQRDRHARHPAVDGDDATRPAGGVIQPHGLPFVVDERLDRIVDLPTIIEVRNEIEWGFELELEIPVLRHHSYPADGDDLAIAVHHADPSGTLAVRGRRQLKTRSRTVEVKAPCEIDRVEVRARGRLRGGPGQRGGHPDLRKTLAQPPHQAHELLPSLLALP